MNKRGHTKTLVPVHPGNTNAVKAGVFSPATLAPRIDEVEAALAAKTPEATLADVLRRELAALAVLGQAMDQSIEEEGIRGRRGDPRNLINLRLRLNGRVLKTADQYGEVNRATVVPAPPDGALTDEGIAPEEETESLVQTVARLHRRETIGMLRPQDVDPEMFLRAVVATSDPVVSDDDRLRAGRLLTRQASQQAPLCTCSATLVARDEFELRNWINEARVDGVGPDPHDAFVAMLVRSVSNGERIEPWVDYRRTWQAGRDGRRRSGTG